MTMESLRSSTGGGGKPSLTAHVSYRPHDIELDAESRDVAARSEEQRPHSAGHDAASPRDALEELSTRCLISETGPV